MNEPVDQLSVQGPMTVTQSQEQFIIDALRTGARAVLISCQDPSFAHVPDEALAACMSASVRVLHVGQPLPSVLELQDMIGNAAEITEGLGIAPQAMARLLLASVPSWQSVVLAIDGADTLPRQTLYYLAQLSNALAGEAPVLQIVFAAGPALLESLSHPDFATFRNRIVVFGEKDSTREDDRPKSLAAQGRALQVVAPRGVVPLLPHLLRAPRGPVYITGRVALWLTGTSVVAVVLAIGYAAFFAYSDSQTRPSIPEVNANAPQDFAVAPQSSPPTPADARETDTAIALLIDQFETAVALELSGTRTGGEAANLADRIETLVTGASPNGRLMVVAMKDRIATKVIAAVKAGRSEEARQLEQLLGRSGNSRSGAAPTAATGESLQGATSQRENSPDAQGLRPNDAGGTQAARKADQPIVFPDLVTIPAAPGTVQGNAAAAVAAGLPAYAPSRVVLTYPRNDKAAAERTTALRQALTAAKVEVVNREAADAHRLTPSIGYYFRSDHDAAVDVSRRVEPLLGRLEPVVLELRGKVPPPGTIEIAIPGRGAVSERAHRNHSHKLIRHVRASDVIKRILRSLSAGP